MYKITAQERIALLAQIKNEQPLLYSDKNNIILMDLLEDQIIQLNGTILSLNWAGHLELQNWDPILNITFNDQLINSRGDA